MTLVCDASVVFGALDRRDRSHRRCAELLIEASRTVIPAPVLVEIDWLASSRGVRDAVDRVLQSADDRSMLIVDLDEEDYRRVRELLRRYADLPLDLVDASVVATAERLEQGTIATLDRRHFSVVQPAHLPAFTLVP